MEYQAGPSVLLASAILSSGEGTHEAVRALREVYDFKRERAEAAVRLAKMIVGSNATGANSALGNLAGRPMSSPAENRILGLFPRTGSGTGADAQAVSVEAAARAWSRGAPGKVALAAARTRDRASIVVSSMLLGGMYPDATKSFSRTLANGLSLSLSTGGRAHESTRLADRCLSVAYAVGTLGTGLEISGSQWTGGTRGWRFGAASWLLPLIPEGHPKALLELLTAVSGRGLRFAELGHSPFLADASDQVVHDTQSMALSASPHLTRWADRPLWFDGGAGGTQVLITEDDDYCYSWVGRDKVGVLVCFDTRHFVGYAMDEPGARHGVAAALGWYIDSSIALRTTRTGNSAITRQSAGSKSLGPTYVPQATFMRQLSGVAQGTHSPPRPHLVAGFVRRLPIGQHPSVQSIEAAPSRLRSKMTSQDTFVRPHQRGGALAHVDWPTRLSKHSALADVLGLIARS